MLDNAPNSSDAITVVIADDDDDIRASLHYLLGNANYSILETTNGMQTLDYVNACDTPTIVLLDLTMPQMSGFEVMRCYAATHQVPHAVRFILLTARNPYFTDEDTQVLQKLQVPLVKKPFDIDEIMLVIEATAHTFEI